MTIQGLSGFGGRRIGCYPPVTKNRPPPSAFLTKKPPIWGVHPAAFSQRPPPPPINAFLFLMFLLLCFCCCVFVVTLLGCKKLFPTMGQSWSETGWGHFGVALGGERRGPTASASPTRLSPRQWRRPSLAGRLPRRSWTTPETPPPRAQGPFVGRQRRPIPDRHPRHGGLPDRTGGVL